MQADHAHRIILSLGLAILCLAASESATAQFILKPSTARHFHANSFVSGSAEIGARFGYALAVGDFNGDGFDDLAIGVPYQPYQGDTNNLAGAVIVAYGAWDGLGAADASPAAGVILYGNIAGTPQHLERFGWSLAVGDFNNDFRDDLAVGAPGYDISGADEGAVYIFYGSYGSGLSAVPDIQFNQAILAGLPESAEQFGHSLAAANFNYYRDDENNTGDYCDDLAIGIPYDVVNGVAQGSVAVLYGNTSSGLTVAGNALWNQDSTDMPGGGEIGDEFGSSLSAGNVNRHGWGTDLVIGIPGEALGAVDQAGAITYLLGTASGLSPHSAASDSLLITQNWFADPGEPAEAGDRFGEGVLAINAYPTVWLHVAASGEDHATGERGLLQAIVPEYADPVPGAADQYRYGATGANIGLGGMAAALVSRDATSGTMLNTLIVGEPYFANGRGSVRIALNGDSGTQQSTGASYYSNAFGLTPLENAHFGKSVAVGNFNGRGPPEIVIGTPLWDHCIPFNPPLCLADRGLITVVDDTLFADGFD